MFFLMVWMMVRCVVISKLVLLVLSKLCSLWFKLLLHFAHFHIKLLICMLFKLILHLLFHCRHLWLLIGSLLLRVLFMTTSLDWLLLFFNMLDVIFDELLNFLFMVELVSFLGMFMVLRGMLSLFLAMVCLFLAMGVSMSQVVLYLLIWLETKFIQPWFQFLLALLLWFDRLLFICNELINLFLTLNSLYFSLVFLFQTTW